MNGIDKYNKTKCHIKVSHTQIPIPPILQSIRSFIFQSSIKRYLSFPFLHKMSSFKAFYYIISYFTENSTNSQGGSVFSTLSFRTEFTLSLDSQLKNCPGQTMIQSRNAVDVWSYTKKILVCWYPPILFIISFPHKEICMVILKIHANYYLKR